MGAVQFCVFDQGVGDGGGFAAGLRTDKHLVFVAQSDCPHGALGSVVIDRKGNLVMGNVLSVFLAVGYRMLLSTHAKIPPAFSFSLSLTLVAVGDGRMPRRWGSSRKAIAMA